MARLPHHRRTRDDHEFEEYVAQCRAALLRTATALAGGDPHLAEDLVQTTLVRLYLSWGRARGGHLDAYARRTLVNCLIDEKRRPHVRRERSSPHQPDRASPPVPSLVDLDPDLVEALRDLPPGMRAAVVLRHVEGLAVEQTAEALGCSVGNVKSQTARGLDRLRQALATHEGARP